MSGTGGAEERPAGPGMSPGEIYDVLLTDLDGTVYRGGRAVPGAASALAAVPATVVFVTNNASRSPESVAEHLTALGIGAVPDRIVTSAQAGAGAVSALVPTGARVLVVGAEALGDEVRARGLVPVRRFEDGVAAVVQGFSPDIGWRDLAEAALVLHSGGIWVATNADTTLPSERGMLPGNGALVSALATATKAVPVIAGKPGRRILDDAVDKSGGRRPLVVGDRLDTDIAGAGAAGMDSLLVFTGVSTDADLIRAPRGSRPTYVAATLAGLSQDAEDVRVGPHPDWRTAVESGELRVRYVGAEDGTCGCALETADCADCAARAASGLRAVAAAAWRADFIGPVVGTDPVGRALASRWNRP